MPGRIFLRILFIVVVIFGLLGISRIASAQGNSVQAFEHVRQLQEKHAERIMNLKDIEGIAVGFDQDDQAIISVFTSGTGKSIPKNIDGVPVEVVVTGKIYALAPGGQSGKPERAPAKVDTTKRFDRPVPIGVSTGHPDITAGTIGCRVKQTIDGITYYYALSNNHVYANENRASIGDNVLQPGPYDGGQDNEYCFLGKLSDWKDIVFSTTANNTIDAALALSSVDLLGKVTPSDGYGTPSSTTVAPSVGMKVKKYGRTTRLTNGSIKYINAIVNVGYDSGTARFVNQIVISPGTFSAGGDSGSLIVRASDNKPVGLLFAGSSAVTIANPISTVLNEFGVTIDGN